MDFKAIIVIGLGCIFIPLVVLGLSTVDAQWETVAKAMTFPVLIIFLIGIVALMVARRR